jgi:hypothetical protein
MLADYTGLLRKNVITAYWRCHIAAAVPLRSRSTATDQRTAPIPPRTNLFLAASPCSRKQYYPAPTLALALAAAPNSDYLENLYY